MPASNVDAEREEERERSSATRELPAELRGQRVMTKLFAMAHEIRREGREPTRVHLSAVDELVLVASAEPTFGSAGARAVGAGRESWRAFLTSYLRSRVDMDIVFDAPDTLVT